MPPQQFPPAETSVAMSPDELGEFLLEYLRSEPDGVPRHHRGNILGRLAELGGPAFGEACATAWSWLERAGLLIYSVTGRHEGVFELSRRARSISGPSDFASLRQATLFSRELLHPVIADAAYGLFLVGKFDLAVFAAFRAVEEEVARQSGCPGQRRDLMAKAFHQATGPLTDPAAHGSVREATMMLFSGAFGCFRNAVGHRGIAYPDASEPASLLSIASQLMRMVDQRT